MTKQELLDKYGEDFLFADGFDDCIMGVVTNRNGEDVVAYDASKIIFALMRDGIPTAAAAREYFYYNIHGAYVGPKTPVYILT